MSLQEKSKRKKPTQFPQQKLGKVQKKTVTKGIERRYKITMWEMKFKRL